MSLVSALLLFIELFHMNGKFSLGPGRQSTSFVKVRPHAHLFYWLYYTTADVEYYTQKPLVIWLHGGPGGSATGSGNFEYFGPVDLQGNKRNNSWVEHVNMLFIDSPVGAGFSYVTNDNSYNTNTTQVAKDLVACMKHFYAKHTEFVSVPLHIFSESYGGKLAPQFALELQRAVERGELNANIKSVTVGNPQLSDMEITLAIPSFLLQTGMVDLDGHATLNEIAFRMVEHVNNKNFTAANSAYSEIVLEAQNLIGNLDMYNIHKMDRADTNYVYKPELDKLMRGAVTSALNIISPVEWAAQRDNVYDHLTGDDAISSAPIVEELLNTTTIKVTFYSGHLDIVCPTAGTINVINKMEWRDKPAYLTAKRQPIEIDGFIEGYEKSDGKFSMFWVNRSGHLVPIDNPKMMNYIFKFVIHNSS